MKTLLKIILTMAAAVTGIALTHPSYAQDTSNSSVMLEIVNGDTAFVVDSDRNKAWWIVGECRREISMPDGKNASQSAMLSQKTSDNVTIGQRQVVLEQQYRFNLTNTPVSVEVYNSIRGGWASVPVRENTSCAIDASCKQRMELPYC